MLGTLAAGPDGKTTQRLGRACVCWGCGFVGLPTNAAHCSEKGSSPAGVCAGCGGDEQTNFVQGIRADGAKLPWIEVPPEAGSSSAGPLAAVEAAAAAEAALEAVAEAPSAAPQARQDGEVKPGQLSLEAESMLAAAARGMREQATFEYRGITLEYSELPDAPSNLLFGNVRWPGLPWACPGCRNCCRPDCPWLPLVTRLVDTHHPLITPYISSGALASRRDPRAPARRRRPRRRQALDAHCIRAARRATREPVAGDCL